MIVRASVCVVALLGVSAHPIDATRQSTVPSQKNHRVLARSRNGRPSFLSGDLGTVPTNQGFLRNSKDSFQTAATTTLENILGNHVGFDSSRQDVQVVKVGQDGENRDFHLRFKGSIDGMEVEGASMVMHMKANGAVYALNGELVSTSDVREKAGKLGCRKAFSKAMANAVQYRGVKGAWVTDCELSYVHAADGNVYKAWKRSYEYLHPKEDNRFAIDKVFASVGSGTLVAVLPTIHGGLAVETRTCNQLTTCSSIVSTTPTNISTSDEAINRAHNYAIGVYNFYNTMFGRDSINNAGMKLVSNVHYSAHYNNAYWNGQSMTYGDGDGEYN